MPSLRPADRVVSTCQPAVDGKAHELFKDIPTQRERTTDDSLVRVTEISPLYLLFSLTNEICCVNLYAQTMFCRILHNASPGRFENAIRTHRSCSVGALAVDCSLVEPFINTAVVRPGLSIQMDESTGLDETVGLHHTRNRGNLGVLTQGVRHRTDQLKNLPNDDISAPPLLTRRRY